ncbi:hypothetical protein [Zavarzinella formosa]|uniref:hypothetical protein n=1 Tax=Zavarzinella formosa TaxID=360055 RepID=UPI0002FCBAB3|nr:hypothetical protein [Zavarzinella formosa]
MDALVTPSRTISLGDQQYVLDGSFATLRAVQEAFGEDVVQLLMRLMDMRVDEVAKLIGVAHGSPADEVGQIILDQVGRMTAAYGTLKIELLAWLNIAIAPKADREKKSAEMEAILKARLASRGRTTSDSPSDPSDGRPASSGEATSGS